MIFVYLSHWQRRETKLLLEHRWESHGVAVDAWQVLSPRLRQSPTAQRLHSSTSNVVPRRDFTFAFLSAKAFGSCTKEILGC